MTHELVESQVEHDVIEFAEPHIYAFGVLYLQPKAESSLRRSSALTVSFRERAEWS